MTDKKKETDKKEITIKEIAEKSQIDETEILKKIEEKEKEFEGLISREGAIYIIGKEYGINISKPVIENLKIKNIIENMRQVSITAKVIFISPIREFNSRNGPGKVSNIILEDETGTISMSIWNEDIEKTKDISVNDIVEIKNCYSKKGYMGKTEIVFNDKSEIKTSEASIDIPDAAEANKNADKKNIKNTLESVNESDNVKIKGCLTTIYEKKILHKICPTCRKKIDGKNICTEHGKVNPEKFLVISGVIDDCYGNINAVFFNKAVKDLTKKDEKEIEKETEKKTTQQFLKDTGIIGKDMFMEGIIKKNKMTGSDELLIMVVEYINTATETKKIIDKMEV